MSALPDTEALARTATLFSTCDPESCVAVSWSMNDLREQADEMANGIAMSEFAQRQFGEAVRGGLDALAAQRIADAARIAEMETPAGAASVLLSAGVGDAMIAAALPHYSEGGCIGLDEYDRRDVVASIIDAALRALTRT